MKMNEMIIIFAVPSAPPNSIRATGNSSTALWVAWSDVTFAHQNGIIVNHKINITLGTSMHTENSSLVVVAPGHIKGYIFSNLLKWTNYTVQVAASTVVGIGPFSVPVTGRTSQDSKLNCI